MNRQQFFHHLRRSQLLSEQQICALENRLRDENPVMLARTLVTEGLLTVYQAEQILLGRSKGFWLGQYRILDRLGQGAMGTVFKAVHTGMGRIVALKVLKLSNLRDKQQLLQFEREIRVLAQMQHPNIIMAYDANRGRGVHFLVMEYVPGKTLQQLVEEKGPLPIGLAADLLRQAASALDYAHERGLVHRDIKPSNLLVTKSRSSKSSATSSALRKGGDYQLKILDFGLAHLREGRVSRLVESVIRESRAGQVYGTADFMSPEQGRDFHQVDIRSDLYSLGCTFYYGLTGQLPFPGDTAMEKLVRHLTEEPRPLRELRPEIPEALAGVIHRLMAKAPEDRFQTPAELLAAVEQIGTPGPRSYSSIDTLTGPTRATPSDPESGSGWLLVAPADPPLRLVSSSQVPAQAPVEPVLHLQSSPSSRPQGIASQHQADSSLAESTAQNRKEPPGSRWLTWWERGLLLATGFILGLMTTLALFFFWRR
ncbi:MAG: serine/threonine-protein kinase [Gemmatales bacterium]|nr:serine/threonine protein kinase [Gemmatales bacterium]MCS7160174.1 serine/threonine protein kinase [Gemmatales bacterium]MDW8175374.1 serine/threonine-protein kinase [Gemmatales bacterium]MDW8221492.1 serine/threonine-protein kinase [Gemmatales bacterium]